MVIFTALFLVSAGCTQERTYQAPPLRDKEALIDLEGITEGIPSFFTVRLDKTEVHFFVVKKKEGLEAYFDACEKCYYRKKGYVFRDDAVICKDCNISFGVNDLQSGFGSCRPVPIHGSVRENNYVIPLDELKKGKRLF